MQGVTVRTVRRRALLIASVGSVALGAPAFAQQAAPGAASSDNVIVVTAQKREQDIQDVPISMSVVGGEQLADMGIKDFNELDRYVPNLYVQTTPGNNAFYIRGIGSQPGNLAFEQTVGLFVDGIYGGHARQFQAPFLDVERIEVLRGPQGALVGKNTSAGAISVVSAKPTRDFRGQIDASYEFELGGGRLFGMVSGPVSDLVSVRLAGQYEKSDGYVRNLIQGGNETKREAWFGRASVLLDSGGPVDVLVKVEGGKVDLTGNPVERFLTPNDPDLERSTSGFPGFVDRDYDNTKNFNASATANIEIGDHVLTSITGYSAYSFEKRLDADFGPSPSFASSFGENFDQLSQEIRLASPTNGALEYIVGGYFHVNDYDLFQTTLIAFGPFDGRADRVFRQENVVWSGFGSATWHIGDTLRLIGSLRYTYDRKIADQTRANTGVVQPTWLATPLSGKRIEREWDPSAAIQWDAGPDAMLYLSYGQGSKAGGFIGAQSTTTAAQFEIEPESAETIEAGAKVALFDRRLRFNISAYRTIFKNLQVSSFDAVSTAFITTNAGKARSQGFESDFILDVADGVSLTGSLAYLDSTYLDFLGAPCPFDNPTCVPANNNAAGRPLPRAPKWSGTLFADIALPVSGAIDFIANGGMTFRSNTYLEESYNPDAVQRSFAKLDLRLGVRSSDKAWELALVGKNLTNKLTGSHAFNTPLAAGIISKFINPPRTIAVQAKLNF
ncbi:TonB-dependent receptor [Sphingopyxis granuli]|uniref:TonB-dependent receptor n=1 Tax=Sphingopyxis granuli TaxID=267128 RepID=UPI0008347F70|nr:TonB-dependent receptor [Sphingopyxis granuli]